MNNFVLKWKFTNGHEWIRSFATQEEALLAVYNFGLLTHPHVQAVQINHVDESGNIVSTKTLL